MLLVLAGLDDAEALWFAQAASAAGHACTVLTTEAMSFARKRSLRLDDRTKSSTVELTDGTVVHDTDLSGVLNRFARPPDAAWRWAAPAERDYATAELHAFVLGWLHGLRCPVRNRPAPTFLAGPAPHALVAATAAQAAGFACPAFQLGSDVAHDGPDALAEAAWRAAGPSGRPRQVVCLDGAIIGGPAPADVHASARTFAKLVDAAEALVGLNFVDGAGTWWFAGMTALPRLSCGGSELVGRLTSLLGTPDRTSPP